MVHDQNVMRNTATQTDLTVPCLDTAAEKLCQYRLRVMALEEEKQRLQDVLNKVVGELREATKDLSVERATSQIQKTMARIMRTDTNVMRYTGVPSKALILGLLEIVNEHYPLIKYWAGSTSCSKKSYKGCQCNKPGRRQQMSRLEELVLVLTSLRTGMPQWMIADLFDVSRTLITENFTIWIKILTIVTSDLRRWPSKGG